MRFGSFTLALLVIVSASCSDAAEPTTTATTTTSSAEPNSNLAKGETTSTAAPAETTSPPESTSTSLAEQNSNLAEREATTSTSLAEQNSNLAEGEATTTTASALPPFPPARARLEHGGDAWVVILAASEDFNDPFLDVAIESAAAAGYETSRTDCDLGVAEAIGLAPDDYVASVSVYLQSETDAQAALLAFEAREIPGIVAKVLTFCLD